jgi:thiosulfate dehydrogenase [quinone] large subunit
MNGNRIIEISEPRVSRFLFADTRMAWVWLPLRIYVGWQWLQAGWGKVNSAAWTGAQAGTSLQGFLGGALQKTAGAHPDVSSWYAAFLQNVVIPNAAFFSYLVAYGELLVGVALIIGAFTGIAAFFGAFMNINYLFAGTVSINPFLLFLGLLLILAWRNAGWLGVDRWLLPMIGVPWQPGKIFKR